MDLRPERRAALLATGLGTAVLLHGLYDFPLLVLQSAGQELFDNDLPLAFGLLGAAAALLLGMGSWAARLVGRLHAEQLRLKGVA